MSGRALRRPVLDDEVKLVAVASTSVMVDERVLIAASRDRAAQEEVN